MIDIKKLMVGDWVNYRPGWKDEETNQIEFESGSGYPVRIEMIYCCSNEGLVQYYDGENDGIEAADYELFPLPLTTEILDKNGFKMESNGNYRFSDEDEGLEITFFPKEENYTNGAYDYVDIYKGCLSIIELPVSYVHELQHCLKLVGMEKEIVL